MCIGQENSDDFCSYRWDFGSPCWASREISDQMYYWPNGNLKTNYQIHHGSIRTRHEYFESGNLKYTVEVYQKYEVDTSYTEDPDTGELVAVICVGFQDIAHGQYHEYKDRHIKVLHSEGQFKNNKLIGAWFLHHREEGLIVANFNEEGLLEGDYYIYYYTTSYNRDKLKLKGQYAVYDYHYSDIDRDTGERIEYPIRRSHRSGTWIKFDYGGDTLQVIDYQWKRK